MTIETPGATRPEPPRVTVQALFGLMVIAIGVLFTLENLGVLAARDYWRYWPAGLVAAGLLKIYNAAKSGQGWIGGLFLVGLGSWWLLEGIAYVVIDARQLMPLGLLALGGFLVWRGFGGRRAPRPSDGHSSFSALAILGGVGRRSNSPTFRGADLTAVMGGCDIDLRQASMERGTEAVIDVFALWGGIEIKVPSDWTVVTRAVPIMGGVEDKTEAPQSADKRLVIRGLLIMGGASVKN